MSEQIRQVLAERAIRPCGDRVGFRNHFKDDFISGFLVFLIALPLCLGISFASGFPPIAGIFTAIVGSLVATAISNSELTIKGPAAGLIVIVLGCIEAFGGDGMTNGWTDTDTIAYRGTLAVAVVAGILQIFFGVYRAGILGEFFPSSSVHGMLAAIGVIIISKQIPVALGVSAKGDPLALLRQIPEFIMKANPAIASIGLTSILLMFVWPLVGKRLSVAKLVPSPLIVLLVAVPMGMFFDLMHQHSYVLQRHEFQLGEQYLVQMPNRIFGMFDKITTPDFSALYQPVAWKWVFMFFIIGSLESVLSAKAVDLLDPWKRKTNLDRDVIAVGAGNVLVALLGGLPMISEIVRSKANIDNGGKTRFANMWHGVFLLICVALLPTILHRIPMAALAGMLVYTGFRLAHPNEFLNVFRIGREQFVIFVTTLLAVLATDLLVGIGIGIAVKFGIHIANGVPIRSLFWPNLAIADEDGQTIRIIAGRSAVFSNWIPIRRQIEQFGLLQGKSVILDLSATRLVDHSVMHKLHEMEIAFKQQGLQLQIIGLDSHMPLASHKHSARRRSLISVRRVTIVAPIEVESNLVDEFVRLGATSYTLVHCQGAGRIHLHGDISDRTELVRIEVIAVRDVCEAILNYLNREVLPKFHVTACVETVAVSRLKHLVARTRTPS